jgi:hypothetical protein
LEAGVLIVGSLDWDEDPPRPAWRAERLDLSRHFFASAPIRYGRKSGQRHDTYTMVFSHSCELGQAKVIPFRNRVSTPQELIAEAQNLWMAEDKKKLSDRVSGSWGCVCLLVRPDAEIPAGFIEVWANYVSGRPGYDTIRQLQEEGALVEKGRLNIPWPVLINSGEPVPFDLLLATATDPNGDEMPRAYPSAENVAMAWARDAHNEVNYFWKNRDSGILTAQDEEIMKRLPRRP